MSALFESYLAGQVACLMEFAPMFWPTINSYKRLVDGFWAPVKPTWGVDNRTASFRVHRRLARRRRASRRAARAPTSIRTSRWRRCIAAGLHGVEKRLKLAAPPITGTNAGRRGHPARAAHADRDDAHLPAVGDRARLARRRLRRSLRRDARLGMAPVARRRHRLGNEALLRDHLTAHHRRFAFPTDDPLRPRRARELVAEHLREQGLQRPLVVTDKGLAALPLIARASSTSSQAPASTSRVFGGVFGNPTASQAMAGAAAYRAHRADCVVGIGGGAALDVAKVVGADGDARGRRARVRVGPSAGARRSTPRCRTSSRCRRPSGTGSEVGRSRRHQRRRARTSSGSSSRRSILAKAVFADPELTLGLPPAVTAATGMDALTHNVESYLSPAYHPLCDGIALEGARIAARALRDRGAASRPTSQARGDMMMSSMMGAIAFQKDLGAVHSCAHALGTVCDLHHGLANALMIDTVLRLERCARRRRSSTSSRTSCGAQRRRREALRGAGCGQLKRDDRHRRRTCRRAGVAARRRSRAWSRSRSPTSATRPIRARDRAPTSSACSRRRCDAMEPRADRCARSPSRRASSTPIPSRADLHRQDAAVRRAVDRALGRIVERRAGGDGPEPGRRDAAGATSRSPTTPTALDALVLEGGSDVSPGSYGETPLEPKWSGDRIRDDYEIALLRGLRRARQARARHLPRPAADERRVRRHAAAGHRHAASRGVRHRDASALRPQPPRGRVRAGTRLARVFAGRARRPSTASTTRRSRTSRRASSSRRAARDDGMIEAIRRPQRVVHGRGAVAPRVPPPRAKARSTTAPLLDDFLAAARAARTSNA